MAKQQEKGVRKYELTDGNRWLWAELVEINFYQRGGTVAFELCAVGSVVCPGMSMLEGIVTDETLISRIREEDLVLRGIVQEVLPEDDR